jgi:pre-mRNA-splicing factor RBM22/SLT11
MPRDRNDPLSKQNTKDRFFGSNDPVAMRMMGRQKEKAEKRRAELKARGGEGDERAVSTLYVRFTDEGTKKNIREADLREKFYSFGEISSVRMHADKGAFIEFTTPQATEHAIASTNRSNIGGRKIIVNWARVPKRGAVGAGPQPQPGVLGDGGKIQPAGPPGGFKSKGSAAAAGFSASGNLGVPRPGGGVIRRPGSSLGPDSRGAAPKPYYKSADPGRLGSRPSQPES